MTTQYQDGRLKAKIEEWTPSAGQQIALGQSHGMVVRVYDHGPADGQTAAPRLVFVDSFRSVVFASDGAGAPDNNRLQQFVQQLGMLMTSWQATTFLIGEYVEAELRSDPVFTVADGLLWLYQSVNWLRSRPLAASMQATKSSVVTA
jgi:hypothetical protein